MSDFFDYLDWRGDLSFRQSLFNPVDALILCRFSYIPLDHLPVKENLSLGQVAQLFFQVEILSNCPYVSEIDLKLVRYIGQSRRFKNLKLTRYESRLDLDRVEQFAAMTIRLNRNTRLIAYRGTDRSIVGWKEDFNMTYMAPVPAQSSALAYLEEEGQKQADQIILSGHSKGGNLALYAALYAKPELKDRIQSIYALDAPGFNKEIPLGDNYQAILKKIKAFVPECAIVGQLLNLPNLSKTVVKSTASTLLQHDTSSWQIQADAFVTLEDTNALSKQFDQDLKALLNDTPKEELKQLSAAIFDVIMASDLQDIREWNSLPMTKLLDILRHYTRLDKATTERLMSFFQLFAKLMVGRHPRS